MSMDGEHYSDMEGNKLPDASGQTGKEAEIITEAEIEAAFTKFMPCTLGAKLASALCRPPVPVTVKDDEADAFAPDDGAIFDENGRYLSGVPRTPAQEHVNEYSYGDDRLLELPESTAYHSWFQSTVKTAMSDNWYDFYNHNLDDPSGRAAIEVAIAVCAIRKAFPDQADGMIKALVQDNCLYGPFWDEAVKRCPEVLFGPLNPFKIQYDTTVGGIRVVRADMGAFTAVFTCNTRLGHCTAQFYGKAAFSPDIQYADGRLCLGYPPMAIPPGCEDDFEDAWCEARDFAGSYGGTVAAIISAVESGKELKEPAPAP